MKAEIEFYKLSCQDLGKFIELIRVFEKVFKMKNFKIPGSTHLQELLNSDSFLALVALHNNKVLAGLTAYTMQQYYSSSPVVYVYDLAVSTEFQRQGIGRQLIKYLHSYCKENKIYEIFVQADLEDDYAIDFYRSTGGEESRVVNFSYFVKDKKSKEGTADA